MYHLLALLTGLILAVMISINGSLTQEYGTLMATVIIHVAGTLFALLICVIKKKKTKWLGHRPGWIYLGGAVGVLTTVFNNLSFGYISMTSIVALGLFGQTVTSLSVDCLGLFGMEKHPLKKEALIGIVFSMVGIGAMLDRSASAAFLAVLYSFGAGITVVLSRTINARLSQKTGALESSFINHLVGLLVSVAAAVFLTGRIMAVKPFRSLPPWIYLGGTMGVVVVLLFNITVPMLPAFRQTTLTFVGQLFMGIVLDLLWGNGFSDSSFTGGMWIAAGVAINLVLERHFEQKKSAAPGK